MLLGQTAVQNLRLQGIIYLSDFISSCFDQTQRQTQCLAHKSSLMCLSGFLFPILEPGSWHPSTCTFRCWRQRTSRRWRSCPRSSSSSSPSHSSLSARAVRGEGCRGTRAATYLAVLHAWGLFIHGLLHYDSIPGQHGQVCQPEESVRN